MDLSDTILQSAKDSVAEGVAQKINISKDEAGGAVAAALPVLVQGLAKNALNKDGAQGILSALDRDHDGSILDDIPGMLGNDGGDGEKITDHILGDKKIDAAKALADKAGIDTDKAGSLLAMLAPIVMGYLGKQKKDGGLDAGSLAGTLGTMVKDGGGAGFLKGILDKDGDGKISDDLMDKGMDMLGGFLKKK